MQRSAHNRGQQRRVAELRTYDRAVGEIRTALDQILSVIDDPDQMAEVTQHLRQDRERLGGPRVRCTVTRNFFQWVQRFRPLKRLTCRERAV
jgi:hypothetical protein